MSDLDPMVSALVALCSREGGYKSVADKAKISPDNLWQIISGTKLPSGNPRGVGPNLRAKLTQAYPEWLVPVPGYLSSNQPLAPVEPAQAAIKTIATLAQITEALAGYLMHMDEDGRDDAADILRKLAHKPENHARAATMLTAAFHAPKRKSA